MIKFNIWHKETKTYITNAFIETLCAPFNEDLNDLLSNPNLVFLRHTGLNDYDDNPIVEGDILIDKDGNEYVVYWDKPMAAFSMQHYVKFNEVNDKLPTCLFDENIKDYQLRVEKRFDQDTVFPDSL